MNAVTTIFISGGLSVLVFPTLAALYLSKATSNPAPSGATTSQKVSAWTYSNIHFWFLIIGVIGFGYLQVQLFNIANPKRHDGPELEFLNISAFEKEIDEYVKMKPPPNWNSDKKQLLLKFELAEYAWNKQDYVAVIDSLRELDSGKDDHGNLLKIPSYVVSNNLGCAYYKDSRNENFDSIRHLFNAKERVSPSSPNFTKVTDNIKRLDKLVNTLD